MFERKSHWESIYTVKAPTEVSWYQPHAEKSLELITRTGLGKKAQVIDVGGGASTLAGDLLLLRYENITVLDIAASAIERTKGRLGDEAGKVTWLEADITEAKLPLSHYDLWHDRAVFHFLTEAKDRAAYVKRIADSLKPGGHIIIASFALDGPEKCSGLDIVRYGPDELHSEFGEQFQLIDTVRETHHTPFGTEQKFIYCYLQRRQEG